MASTYPGSLDAFTNPASSTLLGTAVGGRTHKDFHADINDAVENLEAKLGIGSSTAAAAATGQTLVKKSDGTTAWAVSRIFDVTAFGAVADSTGATGNGTDNTTAINAARVAAETAGGTIYFPPAAVAGNYYRYTDASCLLSTASNIVVAGAGAGLSNLFYDSTVDAMAIVLYSGSHCGVRDLKVKGRKTFTTSGVGIGLNAITNGFVRNCEVEDANCFGIWAGNGCTDVQIRDCVTHGNAADGIHVNGTRITVSGCTVYQTADDGIACGNEALAVDIRFIGNTLFEIGGAGFAVRGLSQRVAIVGNNVKSTFLGGILVTADTGDVGDVTITGNTIAGSGDYTPPSSLNVRAVGYAGGIVTATASTFLIFKMAITGNTIYYSRGSSIVLAADNVAGGGHYAVSIANNILQEVFSTAAGGAAAGTGGGSSAAISSVRGCGVLARYVLYSLSVVGNHINSPSHEAINIASSCTGLNVVNNNEGTNPNNAATGSTYCIKVAGGAAVVIGNTFKLAGNTVTGVVDLTGATSVQNTLNATTA